MIYAEAVATVEYLLTNANLLQADRPRAEEAIRALKSIVWHYGQSSTDNGSKIIEDGEILFLSVLNAQFNEEKVRYKGGDPDEYFRLCGDQKRTYEDLGKGVPIFYGQGALYDRNTRTFARFKVIEKETARFGWKIQMIDPLPEYWKSLWEDQAPKEENPLPADYPDFPSPPPLLKGPDGPM